MSRSLSATAASLVVRRLSSIHRHRFLTMAAATATGATHEVCQDTNSSIVESQLDTPVGVISVKACGHGLHSISYQKAQKIGIANKAAAETEAGNNEQGNLSLTWLRSYFSGKKGEKSDLGMPTFCFPPNESTTFERQVWMTLFEKTKAGETLSYGELAKLIGNPKAARAVGTALKKNPIAIIIPCHRVTRANGDIGKYNGGSHIKEFLLQHEQGGSAEV